MFDLRSPAARNFFAGAGVQAVNTTVAQGMTALLFALFFYYASMLFWQVFYPEGFRPFVPAVENDAVVAQKTAPKGQWNWFADTAQVKKRAPPPSRLDAELIGVIAVSRESGKGMAFIKYRGKEEIYRVGDEIAPAVSLHEIAAAYVTLQRDGGLERLEIKKADSLFASDPEEKVDQAKAKASASKGSSKPAQKLPELPGEIGDTAQLKKILREEPMQLLNLFSFDRVVVGGRAGFSLEAKRGEGQAMLESIGWRQGDVMMSVNGAPVSQVTSNPRLWKALAKASELDVRVIRDGKPVSLVI